MADIVSRARRAQMMSGIRGRNTKPELVVRSHLHRAGLRFRLHARNLPGRPDILLPSRRTAVLVHGCFWHRHTGCRFAYTPRTNQAFWRRKFSENVERDRKQLRQLRRLGWRVLVIWECCTSDRKLDRLVKKIVDG